MSKERQMSRRQLLRKAGAIAASAAVGGSIGYGIGQEREKEIITRKVTVPEGLPKDVEAVTEVERLAALHDLADFMGTYTNSKIVTDFLATASASEITSSFIREKVPRSGPRGEDGELDLAWSLRLPPRPNEIVSEYDFLNPDYSLPTIMFSKPETFHLEEDGTSVYHENREIQVLLDKGGNIRQGVQRRYEELRTVLTKEEMIDIFGKFAIERFSRESIYGADDNGFVVWNEQSFGENGPKFVRELKTSFHEPRKNPWLVVQAVIDYNGRTVISESINPGRKDS